jgi:hypothetical protein
MVKDLFGREGVELGAEDDGELVVANGLPGLGGAGDELHPARVGVDPARDEGDLALGGLEIQGRVEARPGAKLVRFQSIASVWLSTTLATMRRRPP